MNSLVSDTKNVTNQSDSLNSSEYLAPSVLTFPVSAFESRSGSNSALTGLSISGSFDATKATQTCNAVTNANFKGTFYIPAGTYFINFSARMSNDAPTSFNLYIDGLQVGSSLNYFGAYNFRVVIKTFTTSWTTTTTGWKRIEIRDQTGINKFPWWSQIAFVRKA